MMSWRADPGGEERTVEVTFLNELYAKADELADLRRFLRSIRETAPASVHEYLDRLDQRLPLL